MSSTILVNLHHHPLQSPIWLKDPRNVGRILGTSLYASSEASSKTHSDDQAIVGTTRDGYPFLVSVDGFHGCDANNVVAFVEKEVVSSVETFQAQLQKGESPEKVVHAWQEALFSAKIAYLNQGVDFTLGIVVTFSSKGKAYAAGWSIGDIGVLYKSPNRAIINLIPAKRFNGFKDAFDDRTCLDASLKADAMARSGWFCRPIGVGDEIVVYTYLPDELTRAEQEGDKVTLARLDATQLDPLIPSAIDQLWEAIQRTHQIALQQLQSQSSYKIGDDCTLCQFQFTVPKIGLKQKVMDLFHSPSPAKQLFSLQKGKQKAAPDESVLSECSRELMKAVDKGEVEKEINALEKLGDLHVNAGLWVRGAMFLNAALAVRQKQMPNGAEERRLLCKLKGVEALFLLSRGLEVPEGHEQFIFKYRAELKQIRGRAIDDFADRQDSTIWDTVGMLTNGYKAFLASLIEDAQSLLGPPPVKWACFVMGSGARGEMCLFSDVEIAFLLEAKTDEALEYFRTLAQFLELMIINLGETKFPLYRDGSSPTIGGFSLDSGGNTPLGKPGLYELINTPQGLAAFQSERWMEDDIIVMNAMATVSPIVGDKKLIDAYNKAKGSRLDHEELREKNFPLPY